MLMDLFKRASRVVDIRPAAKKNSLFKPDTLLAAKQIAVRAMHFLVVQFSGSSWQVWTECAISKHWLVVEGKTLAG